MNVKNEEGADIRRTKEKVDKKKETRKNKNLKEGRIIAHLSSFRIPKQIVSEVGSTCSSMSPVTTHLLFPPRFEPKLSGSAELN